MDEMKRLPDSEFEIMKAVWMHEPPVTTNILMDDIGKEKEWKVPTLISFLKRLINKGFLRSEKNGKERTYFPLIEKEEYLKFETDYFMESYHGNSFTSLVSTFYGGKKLKKSEIEELRKLLEEE